jgi:hypothetical protein
MILEYNQSANNYSDVLPELLGKIAKIKAPSFCLLYHRHGQYLSFLPSPRRRNAVILLIVGAFLHCTSCTDYVFQRDDTIETKQKIWGPWSLVFELTEKDSDIPLKCVLSYQLISGLHC